MGVRLGHSNEQFAWQQASYWSLGAGSAWGRGRGERCCKDQGRARGDAGAARGRSAGRAVPAPPPAPCSSLSPSRYSLRLPSHLRQGGTTGDVRGRYGPPASRGRLNPSSALREAHPRPYGSDRSGVRIRVSSAGLCGCSPGSPALPLPAALSPPAGRCRGADDSAAVCVAQLLRAAGGVQRRHLVARLGDAVPGEAPLVLSLSI